jgi:hypothetical protein
MCAGLRVKALAKRILAFSRAGTGEPATVPVTAVVHEALDSVAGLYRQWHATRRSLPRSAK